MFSRKRDVGSNPTLSAMSLSSFQPVDARGSVALLSPAEGKGEPVWSGRARASLPFKQSWLQFGDGLGAQQRGAFGAAVRGTSGAPVVGTWARRPRDPALGGTRCRRYDRLLLRATAVPERRPADRGSETYNPPLPIEG